MPPGAGAGAFPGGAGAAWASAGPDASSPEVGFPAAAFESPSGFGVPLPPPHPSDTKPRHITPDVNNRVQFDFMATPILENELREGLAKPWSRETPEWFGTELLRERSGRSTLK